jgi:hypothetical protein
MSSWHERFVAKARTDGALRRQLHELARLDAMAMASANQALSANWSQVAQKVDSLCDQVASRVAQPGEDVDEAAQWISYHCQEVARAVPNSTPRVGPFISLLVGAIVGIVVYRWYQSLILAIVGGIAFMSLAAWISAMRQRG